MYQVSQICKKKETYFTLCSNDVGAIINCRNLRRWRHLRVKPNGTDLASIDNISFGNSFLCSIFIQETSQPRRSARFLTNAEKPVTTTQAPSDAEFCHFEKLTVKFPFKTQSNKNHSGKRINRSVMRVKRQNDKLTVENQKLQRMVWRLQKQARKTKMKTSLLQASSTSQDNACKLTPIKKTDSMIRESGLSPRKTPLIRKALILHNTILKGLRKSSTLSRKYVLKTGSENKLRCNRYFAKTIKIGRNSHRNPVNTETKAAIKKQLLKRRVVSFMKREDNATCCPGKRDKVKVEGKTEQKYILNDTLKNLHAKFLQENPTKKICLAKFCKMRPKNIVPVQYAKRKVCLCQKHQNMALKLRALRLMGAVDFPLRPDDLKDMTREKAREILDAMDLNESVTFKEWRRTEVKYKDKTIKKTVLREVTEDKETFINAFLKEMVEFKEHSRRVTTQYEQIRLLKQNLPSSHVTIQIDFAENYVCNYLEEVQSAYYSKQQVTVHPAVMHYKEPGNSTSEDILPLTHKSFVLVSDETTHTAGTVYAFLKELVPKVQEVVPEPIQSIHYISDSPTSQYRNCSMFAVTAMHKDLFGINATWQFFESGHGKGPCDGVGGSVKRSADLAVKQGKLIQTVSDLFKWGIEQESSEVDFLMVTKDEVRAANEELVTFGATPVKGTMKLHSVMPISPTEILIRETSCFQPCCWEDGNFTPTCNGWNRRTARKLHQGEDHQGASDLETTGNPEEHEQEAVNERETGPKFFNFVVALYDRQAYVGKIISYDSDDQEYHINFMECAGKQDGTYKWPKPADELWIPEKDVLFEVEEPIPTGKSKRTFKLSAKDMHAVKSIA